MTSSQEFIPIDDIKNDFLFLKDGSVTLVISTSAVNFGLLFETEQISIINSFAGFLNSLSFPIQIVVHSRRLDVSSYLLTIDKALQKQTNPALREMTIRYRNFVARSIKEKNVLDKQFYVCLNASPIELGVLSKNMKDKTSKALTLLLPRRDHVIRQLGRLGLKAQQLTTVELIKLFYGIYNSEAIENSTPTDGATPPSNKNTLTDKTTLAQPSPQPALEKVIASTDNIVPTPPLPQPPPAPQLSPTPQSQSVPLSNLGGHFVVEELKDE